MDKTTAQIENFLFVALEEWSNALMNFYLYIFHFFAVCMIMTRQVLHDTYFFSATVQPSIVEHPVAIQAVYPGVSVSFSCRAEGFSMLSYSWFVLASGSDIGIEIDNATEPMYTISDPRYDQDDTGYYCIATNNEGIAVSNSAALSGNFSLFVSSCLSCL